MPAKLILALTDAQQTGLDRLCERLGLNDNQVIRKALSSLYRETFAEQSEQPPSKAAANEDSDVEEALSLIDDIQAIADDVPDRGADFAESVRDKAADIGETIERDGRVTPAQLRALENMRDGLERWLER